MVIAACTITLHLHDNHSLKGKRQVVRSLVEKLRARFNASVAEVADQDLWQRAVIGAACVSGDAQHANEMIDRIVRFVEANAEAEVLDVQVELVHAL